MKVEAVPLEWVNRVWPSVEPYLAEALSWSGGEYTVDHARVLVTSGQWLLLVIADGDAVHGAATLHFFNRPTERVAFVTALAGPNTASQDTFDQLKIIAAARGATVIEGAARESVARLWRQYGFLEKYRVVGVSL